MNSGDHVARTTNGSVSDDTALMRRIGDGDESALATLYDKWVGSVYALVMHVVRDGDEAEDVVEEIFWQVWQQARAFDPARGSVHAWLLTITRSRALDRIRARQRRKGDNRAEYIASMTFVTESDGPLNAESARRTAVQSALRELPAEQRRVLELAYLVGLTQDEIAGQVQVPLDAVKTQMRAGMQTLHQQFGSIGEASV